MNRRHFIQNSSMAVIAVTGLPKAIRLQQNAATVYQTELKAGVSGQTFYGVKLFHSALESLSTATEDEKIAGIQIKSFTGTDITTPATSGEFKFTIKEVTQKGGLYMVKAKLDGKTGNYKLPKGYDKNIMLEVSKSSYVNILSKDGKSQLVHVPYPVQKSTNSSSDGCFLTTACVQHRGLADDCTELQTLRSLRDDYMLQNSECRHLAAAYRVCGPQIVAAINTARNKEDIYAYMYEHMILPSVCLIEAGRRDEAVDHYKVFVKALQEAYC